MSQLGNKESQGGRNFEIPAILGIFLFVGEAWPTKEGMVTCRIGYLIATVAQVSNHTATKLSVYTISTKILLLAGQSIMKKTPIFLDRPLT